MGNKLSREQKEFFKRINEILFFQWDPIGVSDIVNARDEYDSYEPAVYYWLVKGETPEKLVDYFAEARSHMGIAGDRNHDLKIANILIELREHIYEKYGEQNN